MYKYTVLKRQIIPKLKILFFCFLPVELFKQKEMFDVGFGNVCSLEYTRTNTSNSRAKNGNNNDNPKKLLKFFSFFVLRFRVVQTL